MNLSTLAADLAAIDPDRIDPLAGTLAAVARAHGLPLTPGDWELRLGSGWVLAAPISGPSVDDLETGGAHVLCETAAAEGLRLRPLHPPEAAAGLSGSVEFIEHYRDSYVPLIRHALAHGQAVLAWRGAQPRGGWRVITATQDERFFGYLAGAGEPCDLSDPAHLVFVTESREPATIDVDASFIALARRVRTAHSAAPPGVAMGFQALQTWRARLVEGDQERLLAGIAARRLRVADAMNALSDHLCAALRGIARDWAAEGLRSAESAAEAIARRWDRLTEIDAGVMRRLAVVEQAEQAA